VPGDHLPAAAVFDWDGTIVDTMAMIYRANVAALAHFGLTMSRDWFEQQYTPDWRKGYQELGIPEELWDEMADRWATEMARMRPRAMPWARGALRRLRRRGVRLGLVTASTRGVVEPNLARLNLDGVFEVAYYADTVRRSKPHPEGLLRALDDLGVEASQTVYVGDTLVDLEMAAAAGAAFAAIGGTTDTDRFHAAGVDTVWSDVGRWADEVLGAPEPRRRSRVGHADRPGIQSGRHARPSSGRP
jgi:HAD superfamily hydrolase (TIGR01509 family)